MGSGVGDGTARLPPDLGIGVSEKLDHFWDDFSVNHCLYVPRRRNGEIGNGPASLPFYSSMRRGEEGEDYGEYFEVEIAPDLCCKVPDSM